jgi:hypothetical protein
MPDAPYQRLSRWQTFALLGSSSLWLGADHLLLVQHTGYSETYKRFYFSAIQSVSVRRTRTRTIYNLVVGTFAAFFLVAALSSTDEVPALAGFGSIAALLLAVVAINSVRGPTCRVSIKTAVQTVDVPSVSRLRAARKILDHIRPLITARQGELPADPYSSGQSATEPPVASLPTAIVDDLNPPPEPAP